MQRILKRRIPNTEQQQTRLTGRPRVTSNRTDRAILVGLKHHRFSTYRQLATQFNVSNGTIRRRAIENRGPRCARGTPKSNPIAVVLQPSGDRLSTMGILGRVIFRVVQLQRSLSHVGPSNSRREVQARNSSASTGQIPSKSDGLGLHHGHGAQRFLPRSGHYQPSEIHRNSDGTSDTDARRPAAANASKRCLPTGQCPPPRGPGHPRLSRARGHPNNPVASIFARLKSDRESVGDHEATRAHAKSTLDSRTRANPAFFMEAGRHAESLQPAHFVDAHASPQRHRTPRNPLIRIY